ncbi:sucrose-specific PTS transporter subunit IIBC [Companilactobacillus bobalius]|uniref:PTS system sucrose-specific EIIBCA component n=2 Tax=Companilactobacillus bobalius TaxID=2801451 RepID=A0A202F927_9LACO|nr:sucrose-specific PTS transporter subunit IIBC [Companilactobacillus bobalius]KAE9561410.1 PTS sucrose transporter subunit IIABC [Companilactobacillus bobalius]KRK82298.1 sucrose PTS, EIIBCA [Companilactobacillus bobalius DSM 19674]OVE96965.1 Protein-N(pi)-phosphohistidine--sugar phosphotransferase [Companilactobacillus bobalius]GEO59349.1 PTS beta-glucoside transporter subunit EIIBCA [Companilactobacillus paralimentarius]
MAKDYSKLAQQIVDLVGVDNIESVTHCQTRLRFVVKNRKQIDDKKIENLDLVKGVFFGSGQYQVIIGTGLVNDVYAAIDKLGTVNAIYGKDDVDTTDNDDNSNKTKLQRFMAMLSGIFIPIIPVIAATGLFLGLQSAFTNAQVLKLFGAVPSDIPANVNTVISVLTGTVFSFLPALIVWSTFRYFKGTPIIGIVIGLMLVSPSLPNAYDVAGGSAKAIMLFGHIPVIGSQGSVLTALVAGFIGAKMENYFHKHVPNVLDQIITPFLTMLLTFGIMILGVGPIVHWIENLMVAGVEGVIDLPFGIGGFLIGAAYPLMVLVGIHQMMIAIETSLLAATHLNPLIVLEAMYGFANVGVALAMIMRTKSKKAKATFVGAFSSQLFGVSEPTLFGILIRYNFRPLIVTVLTSGFGAAILSIFKVAANSYGLAVVPSYLMYIYDARDLIIYTIVSLLTVVVAFVATNMFAIPKEILVADTKDKDPIQDNTVYAPIDGQTADLKTVNDPVFSSGMMGEGIAIKPNATGKINIYAPQSGKLNVVAETGHAYGLTTDSGIEILVHIGIDTVSLNGKGFTTAVKMNQEVVKGDLLGTFDPKVIQDKGLDDTVMVIITNSKDYFRIESEPDETISNGSALIALQQQTETSQTPLATQG